ncbi:multidrug effflux MFS transporter [Ktedonospora formicarum]|uniref:Bcr/CflA family drug resistance efflux transporter n=1 Tax=Ktedonospora formicarum TaxID=2778364 RepID=A0A8J3I0V3_9CHLR|nr:multidrug effflux MFS transporter [Ktedonospora formicarum]GHO46746.1 Bcr/CflA family drug resistance efflux transporter [Ktedonospora formicarum]
MSKDNLAVNPETALNFSEKSAEILERETPIRVRHVLILGSLSAFGPLSTDMYLPSLPALSHDLHATMSQTQLTLSAGILGLALGQVLSGPVSDALGRKRPLIVGIVAFILSSLLCIVAPNIPVLVALRFIQGMSGATGIVISMAMARDMYAGNAMARFLSLLMLVNGVAPIVAPIIGSQLLRFTSWHGVFITLALFGVALLLASFFGLGETLPATSRQSGGIATTFGAFRDLLRDGRFVGYALSAGFAFAACITYISVSPFILQNIYHLSPQVFGLLFGINALGIVIVGQINGKLVGRISSRTLLNWGLGGIALGGIALLIVVISGIGLFGVLPSLFILVSSIGLIMPNSAALALATTRTAGSASALLGVLQLVIGPVAAPLIGLGGTESALPMALGIAGFGILSLLTFVVLCRPLQDRAQVQ